MTSKRPLGWWDTGGGVSMRETKRCQNARAGIIAELTELKLHRDYDRIAEFTHQVLNRAANLSAIGQEDRAKQLHKGLRAALRKIRKGGLALDQVQPAELLGEGR